jgi:hypothetical protein
MRAETQTQVEREREVVLREAQAQADQLLLDARSEIERLLQQARNEEQRLVHGNELARRQFQGYLQSYRQLLERQIAEARRARRRSGGCRLGRRPSAGLSPPGMTASAARFPSWPDQGADAMERELLARWKSEDLFHRVQDARKGGTPFVFYEGPSHRQRPPRHPSRLLPDHQGPVSRGSG